MKIASYVSILTIVNLLVASVSGKMAPAAQGKHFNKRRAEAPAEARDNGSPNGNALWSADPHRGWVRNDNQRGFHERSDFSPHSKQNRSQNKGSGKGRKLF